MVKSTLAAAISVWLVLTSAHCHPERFSEHLSLKSLRDGRVATRFSFKTVVQDAVPRAPDSLADEDDAQHYTLFPLSLGQILRSYAVTEMHLTLNSGRWDYTRWGYPEEAGVATGAELWAWMGDSETVSLDERWKGLRNALAGLFCASLGSLDERRTTSPSHSFKPEGHLPKYSQPHRLRHATLPSENVCTENLTPFLKLLPCKSSSGIASLLNPHKLFDADWHGMAIHVTWDKNEGVVVELSFQAVFDSVRTNFFRKRDWSFEHLFGRKIVQHCTAAVASVIEVDLPVDVAYSISPEPSSALNGIAKYDVSAFSGGLDVSLKWPGEEAFAYPLHPPTQPLTDFTITRVLTGPTQSRGQLSISITNNLPDEATVLYVETMPWFVQFYLHTMRLTVDRRQRDDLLSSLSYTLPIAHGRPTLFEPRLRLPPNSTVALTMEVVKSFLQYTEHPPDAQRGWDLPPAVLVPLRTTRPSNSTTPNVSTTSDATPLTQSLGHRQPNLQRIYTRNLLVDLATPDFSMPYNVIIMSSTLIALAFGMLFNLLTRKFVLVNVAPRVVAAEAVSK
ncbi:Gpi16 subunit, GPI transamidase component [Rickenella mellea]|uniref:Gpi16 subunit, GPI transamidase component n=1 Tax=Rickenella mellea TaxID=50990 RepID=A0A4Y7PUX5_9AGAM|nr:Gpi16 subunit, GPI transamidase component [Rickenella mellea]